MKISLLSVLAAAFGATAVLSHGTEVRTCINTSGDLRVWVEHWHNDLSSPHVAGTMQIRANHLPGTPTSTLTPDGHLNNVIPANLPDCANGLAPALVTYCANQERNDWVYYDFPTSCNAPVSYTLLAGNTVYLTEGCSQLYPATFSDTFTDVAPPAIQVNGSPCGPDIQVAGTCTGATLPLQIIASDDCDPNPQLTVNGAPNGNNFPVGATTVTAVATDNTGKTSTCSFDVIVSSSGSVCGDPHFKTWSGEKYDFHGICDLVLVHNPAFANGAGMDIHIRTKRSRQWSYVDAAALRIGSDTLEVIGGKSSNYYWINGVAGKPMEHAMKLDETLSGYSVSFKKNNEKSHQFIVDLEGLESIVFTTWNGYVRVDVHNPTSNNFASSVGLMGSYATGQKVGRDNTTVFENTDVFGQEWQVLPEEPKMFHNLDGPQAPAQCEIPSAVELRRRLANSNLSNDQAELACARVNQGDFDLCVFDVLATNDRDVAGAY